jgi:hypothetical protein
MRLPSLLVPYPGPDPSGNSVDVYMYLRPETNGVLTESVIMRTITSREHWIKSVKLVYLANYPGDFIHTRHLVEHHYRLKIAFARRGGRAFTPGMRSDFERKFGRPFDPDRVIGAFEALSACSLDEDSLFGYRVSDEDMLITLGQNVKRYGDLWIVNYDIPAILHRNTFETDIAVMVFRVSMSWPEFCEMTGIMSAQLVEAGVLGTDTAPSRAFHYSKSPWEQLLDGIEFLWGVDVSDGGAEDDISFGAYMMNRGCSRDELKAAIRRPLILYRDSAGTPAEGNIFELSAGMNYAGAREIWESILLPLELP